MRVLAALAPLSLLLCVACPEGGAYYTRTETRTLSLKSDGELRVKGFNGRIRLETWNRDEVEVQADIRENERNEVTLKAESKDGRAEIIASRPGSEEQRRWTFGWSSGSTGVSYVLRVPAKVRAELETTNGQVTVQGLQAPLDVRTSNGRVEIRDQGAEARVRTSNGSVQLEAVQGNAEVTTSNARVEAHGVRGELRVHTSNGSVDARDVEGRTSIRTSNSRVVVQRLKGPATVESSNGSLLAERLDDDLRASTSNAGVELIDVLGKVDVRTSNGSLRAQGLNGKDRGIRLQTSNASLILDLGSVKGELLAQTSRHSRVDIERAGGARVESEDKGEARMRIPGSDQRIELITTHGRITVR